MNDLSDDEHNLLRYYAETERIIHGLVRVPFTSTCGEDSGALRSGVARRPYSRSSRA